jgi:hypothetical protein
MVKRYSDDGKSWWHEPTFTPDEEEDLWRAMNAPPVSVLKKPRRKDEERE